MKMSDIQQHTATWVNLTNIISRGRSKTQKNICGVIPFIGRSKPGKTK